MKKKKKKRQKKTQRNDKTLGVGAEYVHPETDGDEKSKRETNGRNAKGENRKTKTMHSWASGKIFRFLNL